MNPELRERLARVLADNIQGGGQTAFERTIDAILTELEAAGWPATPEVPTKEMLAAGAAKAEDCMDSDYDSGPDGSASYYSELRSDAPFHIYQAMLRARPKI